MKYIVLLLLFSPMAFGLTYPESCLENEEHTKWVYYTFDKKKGPEKNERVGKFDKRSQCEEKRLEYENTGKGVSADCFQRYIGPLKECQE